VRDAALKQHRSSVAPRHFARYPDAEASTADAVTGRRKRGVRGFRIRAALPGQQERSALGRQRAGASPRWRRNPHCNELYFYRNARLPVKRTAFSITYDLDGVRAVSRRRRRQGGRGDDYTSAGAVRCRTAAAYRLQRTACGVFSRQVVGDEKEPMAHRAKNFFAAVDQVPWAGAREYSTITNISDYAPACGPCRLRSADPVADDAAAPQRHSVALAVGHGVFGRHVTTNLHDWGWLYIAPYGWMPMDVTFGRLSSPDPAIAEF